MFFAREPQAAEDANDAKTLRNFQAKGSKNGPYSGLNVIKT